MSSDALTGVPAIACVVVWQLWHTQALQAVPTDLAIEVHARRITIPAWLIGAKAYTDPFFALLGSKETHAVLCLRIALLAWPQRPAAYAKVT